MKKVLLTSVLLVITLKIAAQKVVTISQVYGTGSKKAQYTVIYRQSGTSFTTIYRFGNFTITAINKKDQNLIWINIKTPGILGANDDIMIPYNDCNGYVLYKGGVINKLGSTKLEYLITFKNKNKTFVSVNQVMDTENDRYHFQLEPLDRQLYNLSQKTWRVCDSISERLEPNSVVDKSILSTESLSSFRGKNVNQSKFLKNAIVTKLIATAMGKHFEVFKKGFLSTAVGNNIDGNDNALLVNVFTPHWALNRALIAIDLTKETAFVYYIKDNIAHAYGSIFVGNIKILIEQILAKGDKDLKDDDKDLYKHLIDKYSYSTDDVNSTGGKIENREDDDIATSVEVPAKFPGGMELFYKFISDNISYPPEAIKNKTEGRVTLSFVVNENGEIKKPFIIRGIGDGCDEEVLRVIKLSLNWEPARTNLHSVKSKVTIPIVFSLPKD